MNPVRRAGIGLMEGGERVTWSVAEGRRGRRWREAVVGERGLRHVLLLETGPDGRFAHLELATTAGLLTLHPEGDGTLHGNALDGDGLRHVVGLPWDGDGLVEVEGSAVATAASAWLVAGSRTRAGPVERRRLRITAALELSIVSGRLEQLATTTWRFPGGVGVALDADWLPVLAGGASWPMEGSE